MCALPRDRPARCTASERRRRIAEVQAAAALGEDLTAAARRLCASWGLSSRRNAARYARAALASWRRDRMTSDRAALDAAIATRRMILRSAMATDDFTAALKAQDGIEKLLGIGDGAVDSVHAAEKLIEESFSILAEEIHDKDALQRVLGRVSGTLSKPLPPAPARIEDSLSHRYYREHNAPGRPHHGGTNGTH